jgi:HrpA-like RNA helicase
MDRVDETVINYDLIEDVLIAICRNEVPSFASLPLADNSVSTAGSILIFMPGIGEIRTLLERLSGSKAFRDVTLFEIIPLHSRLSASEQRRAFITAIPPLRKIILSTNIAETSVTIPDVVYVIDSGRVREITRDRRYDSRKLVVSWCSRASAKQRSGRAGRVQPGVCLKLYSSRTEQQIMKCSTEPELQRIPLEEVCLTVLAGEFGASCASFLSQTPQPPLEDAIRAALHSLEAIGAIQTSSAAVSATNRFQNESLTSLGRLLSKLPVDARVGKMLILGSIFHCTDAIVTIAATLSVSKSIFVSFFEDRQAAQAVHAQFFHPFSDFLTYVNVYDAYRQADSVGEGRKFCLNKKLNYSTLVEIQESRCHFFDLLIGLGLVEKGNEVDRMSNKHNKNCRSDQFVHAIVCAGMFPNVGFYPKNGSKPNSYVIHKAEQLFIQFSTKTKLTTCPPSSWIVFSEKFGTERQVSISKTAFIPPISLILFGSKPQVLHTERKLCIDTWIEMSMPASTAVIFREIQARLCDFLSSLQEDCCRMKYPGSRSISIETVICCARKLFPD